MNKPCTGRRRKAIGRRTVIGGLEVVVVDDDDAAQIAKENDGAILHVCIRVADMHETPYPALAQRRRQILCESCRHPIWFDPLSIPKGLIAISKCLQCVQGTTGPLGFPIA